MRERWRCRMEELESLRRETVRDCATGGVPLPPAFECSGSANMTCTCHTHLKRLPKLRYPHSAQLLSSAWTCVVSKHGSSFVLKYACEGLEEGIP